jgi:hypothetical protein
VPSLLDWMELKEGGSNSAFAQLLNGARAGLKRPTKRKTSGPANDATVDKQSRMRRSGGSSFETCPLCGSDIHRALLEAHASNCAGLGTASLPPNSTTPPSAPEHTVAAASTAQGTSNAFSVMLASAAELKTKSDGGVFACDFDEKCSRFVCRWKATADAPIQQAAWREVVDIRDKSVPSGCVKVVVTSNMASYKGVAPVWQLVNAGPPPGEPRHNMTPSALKSAVQKCIRLGKAGAAVRCAAALLALDASDGIRRLAIIAIEDAILPPEHLPLLVWLMAAQSKGYTPSAAHVAAVLRCVHDLATVGLRDSCEDEGGDDIATISLANPPVPWAELRDQDSAMLVRCLLLRAAFGGMTGDVVMLRGAARCWARRFTGLEGKPPPSLPKSAEQHSNNGRLWLDALRRLFFDLAPAEHVLAAKAKSAQDCGAAIMAELTSVLPLRMRDVPATTFDMHCSNIIPDVMKDVHLSSQAQAALELVDELDKALGSVIWHMRSRTNVKSYITDRADAELSPTAQQAWLLVSKLVDTHQTRALNRAFR